jgi:threonine dehydratase
MNTHPEKNWSFGHEDIAAAYRRIKPYLVNTPIIESKTFSELCQCEVLFKLENLQMTGSYKERGALNKLLSLSDKERHQGVIAASAGNHAQAVAYHAARLGISTKVVMPKYSPLVKIKATEHWGADVILEGETFDDAFRHSQVLAAEEQRTYLHPFADAKVVEGQGTLALEIMAHPLAEDIDAVIVPIGGGGLVSGVATYIKQRYPKVEIIGVEETSVNGMSTSLQAGEVIELAPQPMIADGIAVRRVYETNLGTVAKYVDEIVSVNSDEIANAIMLMLEIEKNVIEGAAAVTLAALLNHRIPRLHGKKVLAVISGGNIDVNLIAKIINRGLTFDGRIIKLDTVINDIPGTLESLLASFRKSGANILDVHHHRFSSDAPIGQIGVTITAETRNQTHIDQLKKNLSEQGYPTK